MDAERYLDIAIRYHTIANTTFNFFFLLSVAMIGWVLTLATSDRFQPAHWRDRRYWIMALYVTAAGVCATGQYITGNRVNAALAIGRGKLLLDDAAFADAIALMSAPYRWELIVALIGVGTVFMSVAIWLLLGGSRRPSAAPSSSMGD